MSLKLCELHKQEWKQSHYDCHNCDYCKKVNQVNDLKIENENLRDLLMECRERDE